VTMDECVELARELGARVGEDLGIPVYLYEHAAATPERENLANIRVGEYEGLAEKIRDPVWKPDFGPAEFNARTGATAVGARKFLIAYNVNLNTREQKIAQDIALSIREAGRNKRDDRGKFVRDESGEPIKAPGTLKATKAVGWYIKEYQRAQISINLTDFEVTPPHAAFDEVVRQADQRGVRVTGSELVGLIPLQAMRDAGIHYLKKAGSSAGVPEADVIENAIQSLGLQELGQFDPQDKIIEYRVAKPRPLIEMGTAAFVDLTSTDAPVPGGGSVAALAGALASALAAMVANLTVGKKGYKQVSEEMKAIAEHAQIHKDVFLRAVDDDAAAFDSVMAAFRLPSSTDSEAAQREQQVQVATRRAIEVPLSVLIRCGEVLDVIAPVAEHGNVNSVSDAGVAALALRTAAGGAFLNVRINMPGITDKDYVTTTMDEANGALELVNQRCDTILAMVNARLEAND